MVDDFVLLRGISAGGPDAGPTIIQRTDQEFLPAVLDELSKESGVRSILRGVAANRDGDNLLKLFQPVHRTFYVALTEVVCDRFGGPRLDPSRIESAGLVLRRVVEDGSGAVVANRWEGWRQSEHSFRGWVKLGGNDAEADPDPARRRAEVTAGHPEIDRHLMRLNGGAAALAESFSPLFVAPPEVCKAAGKTILYGVVALTSSEVSEAPAPLPSYDSPEIRKHISKFLKQGKPTLQRAGQTLHYADAADPLLLDFMVLLRQLAIEFDAFGSTAEALALFRELNEITLSFKTNVPSQHTTRRAGDFLQDAVRVLVERDGREENKDLTVTMPVEWPDINAQKAERVYKVITAAMGARLSALRPSEGRFDDLSRRFQIRAFARIKSTDGCPPRTVWSRYSEPFTIARWYEGNGLPPVHIELPGRASLKKLKPNVAFSMPKDLFNFLQSDPKEIFKGEQKGGGGTELDWICGFSIPIITFCAFICLNIFLTLFDLFFSWMLYIKICIPFPKKK